MYYQTFGKICSIYYSGPFVKDKGYNTQFLCTLPEDIKPVLIQRICGFPYHINVIIYNNRDIYLDAGSEINKVPEVSVGISFLIY